MDYLVSYGIVQAGGLREREGIDGGSQKKSMESRREERVGSFGPNPQLF